MRAYSASGGMEITILLKSVLLNFFIAVAEDIDKRAFNPNSDLNKLYSHLMWDSFMHLTIIALGANVAGQFRDGTINILPIDPTLLNMSTPPQKK